MPCMHAYVIIKLINIVKYIEKILFILNFGKSRFKSMNISIQTLRQSQCTVLQMLQGLGQSILKACKKEQRLVLIYNITCIQTGNILAPADSQTKAILTFKFIRVQAHCEGKVDMKKCIITFYDNKYMSYN